MQRGGEALAGQEAALENSRKGLQQELRSAEAELAERDASLQSLRLELQGPRSGQRRGEEERAHLEEAVEHLRQQLLAARQHGLELVELQQELQQELEPIGRPGDLRGEAVADGGGLLGEGLQHEPGLVGTARPPGSEAPRDGDAALEALRRELREAQLVGRAVAAEQGASIFFLQQELREAQLEALAGREAAAGALPGGFPAAPGHGAREGADELRAADGLRQELQEFQALLLGAEAFAQGQAGAR